MYNTFLGKFQKQEILKNKAYIQLQFAGKLILVEYDISSVLGKTRHFSNYKCLGKLIWIFSL